MEEKAAGALLSTLAIATRIVDCRWTVNTTLGPVVSRYKTRIAGIVHRNQQLVKRMLDVTRARLVQARPPAKARPSNPRRSGGYPQPQQLTGPTDEVILAKPDQLYRPYPPPRVSALTARLPQPVSARALRAWACRRWTAATCNRRQPPWQRAEVSPRRGLPAVTP